MKKIFLLFFFALSIYAQTGNEEKFVEDLLSKMTLEEKIGQLVEVVGISSDTEQRIQEGGISSILGIKNADLANKLQKIAVEESRLGIPLLYTNDVIHGYHTTFPIPLAEAASWNPELIEKACQIAAMEAAAEGTHLTFAPMVDIARDPRWGRIAEGSGEDPFLGSILAKARVKGFQGNDLSSKKSIGACAKHYVGYGAAEAGKDYNTVDMSERRLREVYLPPFKSAVDAGVVNIMSAFNDFNGIPASANHYLLTEILRDEWKWDGFVISDYNSIGELVNHRFADNKKEAALKALTAGVDMDMVGDTLTGNCYSPYLKELVEEGVLAVNVIDEAVKRVLRTKLRLGLFVDPYVDKNYYKENHYSENYKKETALQLARESIVLLKNDNNILPLKKDIGSIAVIGELADNKHHPLGPWNSAPVLENVVTPLEGITAIVSGSTQVNYERAFYIEVEDRSNFDEALKAVEESQIIIMFMGETREMSGEAASRSDIDLPGVQMELLEKIIKTGKEVIVVLMNGRPLALTSMYNEVSAIVESWYLGDQHGNALAEVLFGDFNPSGKLPVTFPRSVGQVPIYYSYKSTGRPAKEADRFTSKYLDLPNSPLFPFGFGLSYTTFKYSGLSTDKKNYTINDTINIEFNLENIGNMAGEEISQLYIRDECASITRPVKELKGFLKNRLKKGETRKLLFQLPVSGLSFYNEEMKLIVEPGEFVIMVGGNSEEVISKKIFVN